MAGTAGPIRTRLGTRRLTALVVASALAILGVVVPSQTAQAADPPPPPTPETVTADALPTWQINGVVWSQAIVGDVVYVTGSFTRARPPGVAAGGAGEVVANNIFAYRLSTGLRVTTFATNPGLNAQGMVIRASADGTKIFVGGDFTTVNGAARGHVAVLNASDGSLFTGAGFTPPNVTGQVRGLGVTPSTLYVGGNFLSANGQARTRLAAFTLSNGAMTSWAPAAAGGYVWAMTMSPDLTRVIPAGSFTTLAGQPAYGMGSLMASTGAVNPWPAQDRIRDAGADGAITSLKADGTQIYGTAYSFTQSGTADWEGTFAIDPMSGQINWADDCLGDTYDIAAGGDVLYNASHQHDCSVVGGWPDTNPRVRWQKAAASSIHPTGTTTRDDVYGWAGRNGLVGVAYAEILHWYPNFAFGAVTPAGQAAWAVDATPDGQWVVYGGEFPRVNNVAQQGLVRFRGKAGAPKKVGPTYTTVPATPTPTTNAVSLNAGSVRVSWGSAWDMDNKNLKYEVLRNNNTFVYTTTGDSSFWQLPSMGFIDRGLTPGSTARYQVRITDPDGNILWSPVSNTVTVGSGSPSAYAQKVVDDGASHLWRLGESSGSSLDWAGFDDLTMNGGYTRGAAGAINGDSDKATSFGGGDGFGATQTPIPGPDVFSLESWFKTTTTSGGKIVGFGNANTGTSTNYDRHIYMEPDGRVTFGIYHDGFFTATSGAALNDGQWHQAVGTMGPSGLTLYVDGRKVGSNGGTSVGQAYSGYWRVGGDSPWSGNAYFAGDIDDVAVYPTTIPLATVQSHYTASGRTVSGPTRPADAYGQAVWDSNPDIYWRLGDTNGTAKDSGPNESNGTYQGGYTQGQNGAFDGATNKAVAFGGSDGFIASNQQFSNPHNYTLEAWFKTTTDQGGKIIGFGCSQTGVSGCYDRHIYMNNDGTVVFGVWTGFTNTITSPTALNDGLWHHVVASQSNAVGMRLYVDGTLAGSNGQTDAQDYAGYWRVGGDNHWGCCSPFINATIDEVAVYSSVLSASTVTDHFLAGGGTVPNQPPAAAFSHDETFLQTSVNGSTSADPDGTIASYSWNWGDGTANGSGVNATHTYALAGSYTVTLTVTDNDGDTGTATAVVAVNAPPPNQVPVAAFTHTESFLKTSVNGSTSDDPDGTIASYSWNWGDGTANGSGVNATHTYALPGDYTVTLTVTDDDDATDTETADVTATAPPANNPPTAAFTRTVTDLSVAVNGTTSSDDDGTIASYSWNWGDATAPGSGATANHAYATPGDYTITLTVTDDDGATDTETSVVTVTAPAVFARDDFGRTVANGWGTADLGGAWTIGGTASSWSVSGGLGRLNLNTSQGFTAYQNGVSSTSTEVVGSIASDKAPTGGGQYVSIIGRRVSSTTDYRAKVQMRAGGAVGVWLTRNSSGAETILSTATLAGVSYAVGDRLQVRLQVAGTTPTTVRVKVWEQGTAEPAAWSLTSTDGTAGFQAAGSVGFYAYLSGTTTNAPTVFSLDEWWVGAPRP
jgi:PKD repeat protein